MMSLSPVSTALPTIANDLGVSATTASWAVNAFLLTLVGLLLISGRLGDLLGHQRVFFWGTVINTMTGVLCGFSQDILQLIFLRAIQGIGTAFMSGTSLAILANQFAPEERGKAVGVAAMAASLGALIGVLLSSVFSEYLSWRWLFLSLLPLGLMSIKGAIDLRRDSQPEKKTNVDILGAALLATVLAVFTLAFYHLHGGEATFAADVPYHIGMLGVTLALAVVFLWVEVRHPDPILQMRQLRHAVFTMSVSANGIMHMTMMGVTFLIPFLVERGLGLSPLFTAGMLIATNVTNFAVAPFSGWLYDKTRWRFLPSLGMFLLAGGLVGLGILASGLDYWGFLVISVILGVGLGLFMTPNNTVILGVLPATHRGFAVGMLETSRQLGHTFGVSASSAVLGLVVVTSLPIMGERAAYMQGFQMATFTAGAITFVGMILAMICSRAPSLREGMS